MVVAWLKHNFFAGPVSTAMTVLLLALALSIGPRLLDWAVIGAVFSAADPASCREARGACWAVIAEKHRVMLFGTYPYDQHWRGVLAAALILGMMLASAFRASIIPRKIGRAHV